MLEKGAEDGSIECLQANFASQASREKAFKPKQGSSFDYVFDLTGETDFRAPEVLFVEKTARIACQLGEIAAQTNVKAYVRSIPKLNSLFETKDGKSKPISEDDNTVQPITTLSLWHWEAARALADIPTLNLVIARPGLIYGHPINNEFTGRLLIAEIYKFVGEDMQMLWSPDLPYNTLHADDFADAMFKLAQWMAGAGAEKAAEVADSPLPPCRPPASSIHWLSGKRKSEYDNQEMDFLAMRRETIHAPLFNITDDGNTTLGQLAAAIAKAMNMDTVVEEANEQHMESWPKMLEKSQPPISTLIFTPEIPRELMAKHATCLDSQKIRRILNWKPAHPRLTEEVVAQIHQAWLREDQCWPKAAPLKSK